MMKILNYLTFIAVLFVFASCEKESFNKQTQELPPPIILYANALEVQNGMLVFDSEENFKKTFDEVKLMNFEERKAWEENLGFKSFDRLCNEIRDAEIELANKYEELPIEEQQKLIKSGNYEKYASITLDYLKKGVAKIAFDQNKEEYLDFACPMNSFLINEEGFVVVGNEIRQYTEDFYKVIKSRDYSKIKDLSNINIDTDNKDFYVTNLKKSTLKSLGVQFNFTISSLVISGQRVTIREYYNTYYTSAGKYAEDYRVYFNNEKRNIWGNWKPQDARSWFGGHSYRTWGGGSVDITSQYINDYVLSNYTFVLHQYEWNSFPGQTVMGASQFYASRWGGPSGIVVRVFNHDESTKVYY